MTRLFSLCLVLALTLAACAPGSDEVASDGVGSDGVGSDDVGSEDVGPSTPAQPTARATVSPTPLVIPTIVARADAATPSPTVTSSPTGTPTPTATSTAVSTATPVPSATPRPIPTAAPTARPVQPTATPVPPTATPTPNWVNPDCYVGTGAADEPIWWCGGKICVVGALHYGCPTTPATVRNVQVGCTISDRDIRVDEIITLRSFQNPENVPIVFAFNHGDGTLDKTAVSQAYYELPGQYDVIMLWQHEGGKGSTFCGTVTVVGEPAPTVSPTPVPTQVPAVDVQCTMSATTLRVNEVVRFTAQQNPASAAVAYVFDHGDGTLDSANTSLAYYAAAGYYDVKLRWAHAGNNGEVRCGTVTVLPETAASDYVGRSVAAATAAAETRGLTARIVRIDGQWGFVTQDHRLDRVNFEVDNGVVTVASFG